MQVLIWSRAWPLMPVTHWSPQKELSVPIGVTMSGIGRLPVGQYRGHAHQASCGAAQRPHPPASLQNSDWATVYRLMS